MGGDLSTTTTGWLTQVARPKNGTCGRIHNVHNAIQRSVDQSEVKSEVAHGMAWEAAVGISLSGKQVGSSVAKLRLKRFASRQSLSGDTKSLSAERKFMHLMQIYWEWWFSVMQCPWQILWTEQEFATLSKKQTQCWNDIRGLDS